MKSTACENSARLMGGFGNIHKKISLLIRNRQETHSWIAETVFERYLLAAAPPSLAGLQRLKNDCASD
jgi:hypothetical protein